jgi:hypothetical protein
MRNDDANRLLALLLGITAPRDHGTPGGHHAPGPRSSPATRFPPITRFAGQRPAVRIDDLHPAEAQTWSTGRHEPTLLIPSRPPQA